jgi:hypothetical protein
LNRLVVFGVDVVIEVKVELPRGDGLRHAALRVAQSDPELDYLKFVDVSLYVKVLTGVPWALGIVLVHRAWELSVLSFQ